MEQFYGFTYYTLLGHDVPQDSSLVKRKGSSQPIHPRCTGNSEERRTSSQASLKAAAENASPSSFPPFGKVHSPTFFCSVEKRSGGRKKGSTSREALNERMGGQREIQVIPLKRLKAHIPRPGYTEHSRSSHDVSPHTPTRPRQANRNGKIRKKRGRDTSRTHRDRTTNRPFILLRPSHFGHPLEGGRCPSTIIRGR